jgi:hypothetical protein
MAPPVAPKPKLLPFYDPNFTWETFEGFFCDFLAARPELIGKDGKPCRVVSIHLYGRRGDLQHGIDIRAEMSNGEVWVFECKHYKDWGPKDTEEAIAKCDYQAERKFLLVTRPVSPESRAIIAKHGDWELWDSGDISREFLQRVPAADAAKILYTNFGSAWPKELLGISGSGPLVTVEAKFAPLLEEGRSFHHRLALIGRRDWLNALDAFVEAKDSRIFFFVGRGGLGKSRVLYEWSRDFAQKHKGWTLRFVSDSPADFGTALDGSSKPLVLVFDDAHRLDEVRRALFAELPSRKEIKLVLGLRPGPVAQVEAELISAGFDTTHIERPAEMKRLTSEQALQLAEAALGPKFAERFRVPLRNLSRECPLLAVLAAELLKRGELAERAFSDTAEFRNHVFEGLVREARPVEERFGGRVVRDLLHLLAVLAPVRVDVDFLKRAAAFLGDQTQPDHVSNLLAALDDAGLLLTTGAGVRVLPDLLSDHLAYSACYDRNARNTTFAERVMGQFPPENFPKLLQHLAEAEWRAINENESADSVVEPLWQSFIRGFESGSFYSRAEQLKVWANIAHLQPRRTLDLAQVALQLKTAPPDEHRFVPRKWDAHSHVLEELPSLLKPLAENHREYIAPSLDILWDIGRDLPAPPFNSQAHPITKIGEIARFQLWKKLEIQDEVLAWLDRLIAGDDWIDRRNKPAWLLPQMLNPFFSTGLEEHWSTGNTIHWRTVPLHLDNTAKHREKVLTLLRSISKRQSTPLILAVLGVLEHAMQRAYLGPSNVPPEFKERWLAERRKALEVLAKIIGCSQTAAIHFRARGILLHHMRYEDTGFRVACRKVFETIPDSLDFQIVRAALGNYWDEFEGGKREDWQEQAKRRWNEFVRSTAEGVLTEWTERDILLANLARRHQELTELGFRPDFSPLFASIAGLKPEVALDIAAGLIAQPSNPLGHLLPSLAIPTTRTKPDLRLQLCEDAFAADSDELKMGAIGCCSWWRQEGNLPARARELVAASARGASPSVAEAVIRFIWFNNKKPDPADWELLSALPDDLEHWWVIHRIMERAQDLLENGSIPTPEIADKILGKLDGLEFIGGHPVEQAISEFAKHFPGKVFLMMRRRQQTRDAQAEDFDVVPFNFHTIRFADVLSDSDAAAVIHELEDRLITGTEMDYSETDILQIAIMQSADTAEENLFRILGKAKSPEQLERVAEFAALWHFWPVVLSCPDFTRELLQRARTMDGNVHKKIFRRLLGLPGSRGSSAYQPDAEWKSLIETVEKMAGQYQLDLELGPLYAAAAKHEREWMKQMCSRPADEDDLLDD